MFFQTHRKDYGVQLQIHQNKEFAQILHSEDQDEKVKSIGLKPGHEYRLGITPIGQRSTEAFRGLPKSDRKCQLDDELSENSIFKIYSKANCMYECEISKAYEICQCVPWDFFERSGEAPECDVFGRTCFHDVIDKVIKEANSCPECIPECDMMRFNIKIISEEKLALEGNPYINYIQ